MYFTVHFIDSEDIRLLGESSCPSFIFGVKHLLQWLILIDVIHSTDGK